jgi:CTP:phosphocholine cytidylyltransferase-like protein
MWFDHPADCISTFKLAAVDLATDAEGEKYMEHAPNMNSKPLYATFSEADGEVNRVSIGDINAGAMVGIWIERSIDITTAKTQQNEIYEVDPSDPYRYLPVELSKEDNVKIGISWDLE